MNSSNKTKKTPLPAGKRRRKTVRVKPKKAAPTGREAVQTLVTIMKNDNQPRLQIAAAKALLLRNEAVKDVEKSEQQGDKGDDIDQAIALAKKLLDELAAGKTGGVPGEGAVAADGAAIADHPAGKLAHLAGKGRARLGKKQGRS
jgi:hypothetical protein